MLSITTETLRLAEGVWSKYPNALLFQRLYPHQDARFTLNFMALSPILISYGRPRSRSETQYGLEAIAGVDH